MLGGTLGEDNAWSLLLQTIPGTSCCQVLLHWLWKSFQGTERRLGLWRRRNWLPLPCLRGKRLWSYHGWWTSGAFGFSAECPGRFVHLHVLRCNGVAFQGWALLLFKELCRFFNLGSTVSWLIINTPLLGICLWPGQMGFFVCVLTFVCLSSCGQGLLQFALASCVLREARICCGLGSLFLVVASPQSSRWSVQAWLSRWNYVRSLDCSWITPSASVQTVFLEMGTQCSVLGVTGHRLRSFWLIYHFSNDFWELSS